MKAISSLSKFGEVDTESGEGNIILSGVLGNRIFETVIRMIETKSSAVSLSVPRVTVMNNRTARIRKGDKLYYFEEYDTASIDMGEQEKKPVVGVVGDSTFFHSGMTGLLNMVYNQGKAILIVVDNRTTAMTGHQDHPGTGRTLMGKPTAEASIEKIAEAFRIASEDA